MNVNSRSHNLHKNLGFNMHAADREGQSTILRPKFQPLQCLPRDKEREREKMPKENTQMNMLDNKVREPVKKIFQKELIHAKQAVGRSDNCTKLLGPKLPTSNVFRTDSKDQIDRSSRIKKDGSRSHNRQVTNKRGEVTVQRPRERERERQGSSHASNFETLQSHNSQQNTGCREYKAQWNQYTHSRIQIQNAEAMAKSRMRIQRPNEELTIQTRIESFEPRFESRRHTKQFTRCVKREETISQLECQEDFIVTNKVSTTKIELRKHIQKEPVVEVVLSLQEQIKKFQEEQIEINKKFDNDCITEMINREAQYQSLPHFSNYLDLRQKHINWVKRAVLINWMMEFMVEYGGRRETLNIAVSIVDRYLCSIEHCPLNRLQLVGVASLFVATKLEETCRPSLASFAESTSGVFTEEEIIEQEISILSCLRYEINSPTLHTWCLRLTIQWDLYLKTVNDQFPVKFQQLIYFKNSDEKSYYNYRWLVQLLDFALLDIHTLRYKNRALVASFMYLVLGLRSEQFQEQAVISEFPSSSQYLVDKTITLNQTFNKFLLFSFNIHLCDLHPTIQYCASYFILPLTFELPEKVKEEGKQIAYEDFCSYQTLNKHNIYCLQRRNRSFD